MKNSEVKSKKNALKTIIQFVIFVGLGFFFIWLSLRSLDKEDIRMIFDSMSMINNPFSWFLLVMAALLALFADFARAVRGRLLLETLGYKIRYSMSFYSVMVCYMANLALPRLGEILRCSFLQRFENVPFQKSLGTVVTERAVDIICWIVLLVVAVAMNTSMLSEVVVDQDTQMTVRMWMEQKGLSILSNYFIFILIAFFVALYFLFRLTRKWWSHIAWMMKVRSFLVGIWQGVVSIKDLPHPGRYVLWTFIMWIAYFLGTYSCILALPFLSHAGPGAAFSVLIFGTIAFMISQGGLGSYPLITAGILVLYGVSYTQGLAGGWIGWILQTAVSIGFGLLSLVAASFYKKKDSVNPIPTDENPSSSQ
jgi:hypothetical protein